MEIVSEAKLFVIDFFGQHRDEKFHFHTLEHTMNVVSMVDLMGKQSGLSGHEFDAVLVAAWFHDIGYLVGLENHEESSIVIVTRFLGEKQDDETFRDLVMSCITATKRNHEPVSMAEKVIMDADVAHAGHEQFISTSKKLRKERSACLGGDVSALDYWKETLLFLENLHFYTPYAQMHLSPAKEQNILKVKEIISKIEAGKKNEKKNKSTDKGVESMFRLTASNQMRLSSIADKKANILISINSILISFSAAVVSKKPLTLVTNDLLFQGELVVPMIILFVSSLVSLVFAILSCRPKINDWEYREEDLQERKVNLLFFGNFHRIPYPRYNQAVKEMMDDYDYLYSSMIKDQYFLGQSLFRKYKLLRVAYNIFMYGFIIAGLAFIIIYSIN